MDLDSMQRILEQSTAEGRPIWEIVLDADVENRMTTREASMEKMRATWRAMVESAEGYDGNRRSLSGLVGGDGERMRAYYADHESIGGAFLGEVIAAALSMGENNACMRRIVAAPTAGACGVLPAVLIPLWRRKKIPEERMLEALYVTCAIGSVIASRASISGAAGGCQAEICSASAMAASLALHTAVALKSSSTVICSFSLSQIWLPPILTAWAEAVTVSDMAHSPRSTASKTSSIVIILVMEAGGRASSAFFSSRTSPLCTSIRI